MHTEDPEVRSGARSPTQDSPRVAADSERFRSAPNGRVTSAASRAQHDTGGAPRWGSSWPALTLLYAVLAGLVGLFADFLEHPPAVVTTIIVATTFGAFFANEASLRGSAQC